MKVAVGSKNQVKVDAVKYALSDYAAFAGAEVVGVSASSGVSEQPVTLDETVRGAMNRAEQAFEEGDYGIGIEGGIMEVPHTKTGHMQTCVCAIYDGAHQHIGLSSAFEYPVDVVSAVLEQNLDVSQAMQQAGLTESEDIGQAEGAVGLFTKGRVLRKDYCVQAITMALIHLEQAHLFSKKK